jgi:teichuronic acid biosynthesis glycosyltransferase TuaH
MDTQLPSSWRNVTVISAATPWDGTKFQDRHLAERLSQIAPVLYVDPLLSPFAPRNRAHVAAALREPRLRLVGPNLARLTVVSPPYPERPGMTLLTSKILRRAMRRAVASLDAPVRALISSSALIPVFRSCDEQLKIYWSQDDQVGGAGMMGYSPSRIARSEASRVREADIIVASSPSMADTWKGRGYDPVLIPFGCDAVGFAGADTAAPPTDVDLSRPIAGFVGGLVPDRIDIHLLEAVTDRGHSMLLVGPEHRLGMQHLARLLDRPNVRWVGPKSFDELPSYLGMIDVGLVPYSDSAFNRGSFPLKTLEYLAAGRPVVATDLPATRWLETELISMESQPERFADAVERAFIGARDPDLMKARKAFARTHSWERRARQFAEVIGLDVNAS